MARAEVAGTDFATQTAFNGAIAGQIQGPDGFARSAVNFGAAGGYWLPTIAAQTGDFTLSCWIRGPITAAQNLLRFTTGGLNVTYALVGEVHFDDGVNSANFTCQVDADWVMVTLVRSGGNLICYRNGSLVNTVALTDAGIAYGGRIDIGGANVLGYDMQVLPRAVSADAIQYAYNDVVQNNGNSVGWVM
jgi:hypothetical protein